MVRAHGRRTARRRCSPTGAGAGLAVDAWGPGAAWAAEPRAGDARARPPPPDRPRRPPRRDRARPPPRRACAPERSGDLYHAAAADDHRPADHGGRGDPPVAPPVHRARRAGAGPVHPTCASRRRRPTRPTAAVVVPPARHRGQAGAGAARGGAASPHRLWAWATLGQPWPRPQAGAVPGVGAWTIGSVLGPALGDDDAVAVGDFHLPHIVAWELAGEPRGDDDRMLALLEPYRGVRGRVVRLLVLAGRRPPPWSAPTDPADAPMVTTAPPPAPDDRSRRRPATRRGDAPSPSA